MIAFKNLKDILNTTIKWEKKLKNLYDVAEIGLKDKASKNVISILMKNHKNKLNILENLNIENYGGNEWVRFASGYKEEDIIPKRAIKRDSTPKEIFTYILEYNTKLKEFYSSIRNVIVTEKQKELFDSLVQFKETQISEIKNLIDRKYPDL